MDNLKIYRSSAGSGKTFTLVLEYLKIVLRHPEDYKSVLAITFTNKAAEEMKSRIIEALVSLANGEDSPLKSILTGELPEVDLISLSEKALKNILHDYSSFSVSTIDSFFQRILRALAREIHLPINMQVQVELTDAIMDVSDRLLKDIGVDKELTDWMTELAIQKIDDERGWNLEKDIESVARELFREERHQAVILTREEIHEHYNALRKTKSGFQKRMKEFGEEALRIIEQNGLDISEFAFGSGGPAGYFQKIISGDKPENYTPGKRVTDSVENAERWATKKSARREEIIALADKKLIPSLRQIMKYMEENYRDYITSTEILRKIYLFGIVNDLQKKFSAYRNENNIILLSDTTRLLSDVIHDSDAPFLFEKTGNRYKHLLIDEFQDTSILQWKNLLPLFVNALGSGFTTLVVGDAKQSVYRWRGGNMNLLLSGLMNDLKQFRSMLKEEVLSVNFRSRRIIVDFNNDFFSHAPEIANEQVEMNDFPPLRLAYGPDIVQETTSKNHHGGYIRFNFFENTRSTDDEDSGWKNNAMAEMLKNIRELLGNGYSYKDICILVRKNSDGNEIANYLFQNGIQEIISPDSLLISASPKIEFLMNVFRFLSNNSNTIARSEIIYFYSLYVSERGNADLHELFADHRQSGQRKSKAQKNPVLFEGLEENVFNKILPRDFTANLSGLSRLPVYELCEEIISIFGLNKTPDAYIQRFQDLVLEYTSRINSSLEGFLQWWDNSKKIRESSVIVPANTNAIRIMSIHRSKGLQFPVVMIPLAEWDLLPKTNEIKWMKTENTPYEKLGPVAVMTSNRLKDSYFSEEYLEEISNTVIDNLNLLYVAFTRAEEKLYISCIADNERDLNSVSKLIYRTCKKIDPSLNDQVFEVGKFEKREVGTVQSGEFQSVQMSEYPITKWQNKMTLRSHSGDLLSLLDNKKISGRSYGILVHSVLAGIEKATEIESVIDKLVFEGMLGSDETAFLKREISEVMATAEIGKLFDEGFSVLAERDIIQPDGEVFRPDRVIVRDNKAIVIDFKTGRRDVKHEEQIRKYADLLKSMDYNSVEAKIVYLSEKTVVDF